jgi:hypothetical protein
MTNKTNYLFKGILMTTVLWIAILSLPQTFSSLYNSARPKDKCFVSSGQTVVKWKSIDETPCRYSVAEVCVWPIPHRHITYKVTVSNGTALRDRRGNVIPTTNGEMRSDWLAYDSTTWNVLKYNTFRNRYTDFEPITANEYVVMVQTRYRLFNNVESTLGICTQQP